MDISHANHGPWSPGRRAPRKVAILPREVSFGINTISPQFWGYFSPIHIADILYIYLLILCKKENIAIYSEHWTNGDDMEKTLIYY